MTDNFKLGDRVRVVTERFDSGWRKQSGDTGDIVHVRRGDPDYRGAMDYKVRFDWKMHALENTYNHDDLELVEQSSFERSLRSYIRRELKP